MEKVILVVNELVKERGRIVRAENRKVLDDGLTEVNKLLKEGWKVKDFKPVAGNISSKSEYDSNLTLGRIFAYFVLEKNDN